MLLEVLLEVLLLSDVLLQAAFAAPPAGTRKVVFATNIAGGVAIVLPSLVAVAIVLRHRVAIVLPSCCCRAPTIRPTSQRAASPSTGSSS